MKNLTHQKRLFNGVLRLYNRYSNKLQRLVSEGINLRKQDILSRRLAKMQAQLQGLFTFIKATTATVAMATTLVVIQPEVAQAQVFADSIRNNFGLTSIGVYRSAPAIADLDNDGDFDMLSGSSYDYLLYFENTGSATSASFADSLRNPFNLSVTGHYNTKLRFADLDNDGDLDLMSGNLFGSFLYLENLGTASSPSFDTVKVNPFNLIDIGRNSSCSFADIDNDGDFDLLSGEEYGDFFYFENTGTSTAPAYADSVKNPYGLTKLNKSSVPTLVDLDNDGDLDILSGEYLSNFIYFENTGSVSSPAFAASQTNPFGLIQIARRYSTPVFADLDNDGDFDLLSGEKYGNFFYFENTGTATSITAASQPTLVQVYPNPSQGIFSIVNTAGTNNTYTVTDLAGKQITSIQNAEKNTVINLSALDKGVYFLNISNENSSQTVKLLLQ